MATPTTYTYSITNNFTNHIVNPNSLTSEIRASSISIALDYIATSGDSCQVFFKDVLSDADVITLNKVILAHTGAATITTPTALPVQLYSDAANQAPTLSDGRIRISAEKTNSSTVTFYSYDWTDKTSWYVNSIRMNETLSYTDGYHYNCSKSSIIDTYHGKITAEDFLKDPDGYSYRFWISVNGTLKTEQDPHYGVGGHYTVDYLNGIITFLTPLNPTDIVSVKYHYATNSIFIVAPTPGKQIRISVVEIQFSDDVVLNDSAIFQPYGFVDAFAPQYMTTNGGPYPPGTKIPLGNPIIYKSMQDYLNDSKKTYPVLPAMGGQGWRGIQRGSITLDWDYEGEKVLRADQGMEIRAFLQHDTPYAGAFATATFYCKSEPLD